MNTRRGGAFVLQSTMMRITLIVRPSDVAQRAMKRTGRRILAAGGVMLLAAACGRSEESKPDVRSAANPAGDTAKSEQMPGMAGMPAAGGVAFTMAQVRHGTVAWEAAVMGTSASTATVPGLLVPNEDRTARLGAPAGGRVVTVRVQPGDRVAQGQVLVTLQSPGAGMAQSDVAKAVAEVSSRRAAATYARTARERAERLLAIKAIPRQDYERAIADDEAARASLAQAVAEERRARNAAQQLGADGSSTTGEPCSWCSAAWPPNGPGSKVESSGYWRPRQSWPPNEAASNPPTRSAPRC